MSDRNNATEIIRLTYPLNQYPGWKTGDKVPRPFTGPDGKIYRFKGLAVFVAVGSDGNQFVVDIVHEPRIDRGMIGEVVN